MTKQIQTDYREHVTKEFEKSNETSVNLKYETTILVGAYECD